MAADNAINLRSTDGLVGESSHIKVVVDILSMLQQNRETLHHVIDCDDMLLARLHRNQVIDQVVLDKIRSRGLNWMRNIALVDHLISLRGTGVGPRFLTSLRDDGQAHIANFLNGSMGEEVPLSKRQLELIFRVGPAVMSKVHPTKELLNDLHQQNVILDRHKQRIESKWEPYRMSFQLLEILPMRSDRAYSEFILTLRKHGNGEAANLLCTADLGQIVVMDIKRLSKGKTDGPSDKISKTFNEYILTEKYKGLQNQKLINIFSKLKNRGLLISGTKFTEGTYVRVYAICLNGESSRDNIKEMERCGELKYIMEDIIEILSSSDQRISISVDIKYEQITHTVPGPVRPPRAVDGTALKPRALKVTGFNAEITQDVIQLYFESNRVTGIKECNVKVDYDANQRMAIVRYDNPVVARKVLEKKDHEIGNSSLFIQLFDETQHFGRMSTNVNPNNSLATASADHTNSASLPSKIMVFGCPKVVDYIIQNDAIKSKVERRMAALQCLIAWPLDSSGNIKLRGSLPQGVAAGDDEGSFGAEWVERCVTTLRAEMDCYKATEISINANMWMDLVQRLNELRRNTDHKIALDMDASTHLINLCGDTADVDGWANIINGAFDDLKKAEQRLARQTSQTTKHVPQTIPLQKQQVQETFLALDEGLVLLLEKHGGRKLDGLLNDLTEYKPEVNWIHTRQGKPGCIIRCNTSGLQLAEKKISTIARQVVTRQYPVEPRLTQYLLKDASRTMIRNTAANRCVVIMYPDDPKNVEINSKMGVDTNAGNPHASGGPRQHTHVVMGTTGRSIKLWVGDITRHPVDVVVNAANDTLSHGGGVASALVDAGGDEIQTECNAFIKSNGLLKPGQAYTSTAGKLPCLSLVHTVGPDWRGGLHDEEQNLGRAVLAALEEAARNPRHKTVSMPFISCGIFQFPKDLGARVILRTACEYFGREFGPITEVHIVCFVEDDITFFATELAKLAASFSLTYTSGQQLNAGSKSPAPMRFDQSPMTSHSDMAARKLQHRVGDTGGFLDDEEADDWGASKSGDFSAADTIKTQEGISVSTIIGSIAQQRVDVMLCSCFGDLDLTTGAVAKSLAQAAGPQMSEELANKYPGGLRPGELGATKGFKLSCKSVYYTTLLPWKDGSSTTCEQMLRNILHNSLVKASSEKMKSIAWPTIGCGNLRYPKEFVAGTMFHAVHYFSANNPSSSLRDVRIIVYEGDQGIYEAFATQLKYAKKSGAWARPLPLRREVRRRTEGDAFESKAALQNISADTDSKWQQIQCAVGDIKFEVRYGDITREKCDAIIFSTSNQFAEEFGSAAKAIRQACGQDVSDEVKEGMVKVAVGQLPCKLLLHITASDITTSKLFLEKAFQDVDRSKLVSVTLPATGTGSVKDHATTVYETLTKFIDSKPKHVRIVTVVTDNTFTLAEFVRVIEKRFERNPIERFISKFIPIRTGTVASVTPPSTPELLIDLTADDPQTRQQISPIQLRSSVAITGDVSMPSALVLSLYAFNDIDIDAVLADIKSLATKESVICGEEFRNKITKMSSAQDVKIKEVEKKCGVFITINRILGEIRVKGDPDATANAMREIYNILQDLYQQTSGKILWEYAGKGGQFKAFDPAIGKGMERAFQDKRSSFEWTINENVYRVNFKEMKQDIVRRSGIQNAARVDLPKLWTPMSESQPFMAVHLNPSDQEYKKVISDLWKFNVAITKVERIQNPVLYRQFKNWKNEMDRVNGTFQSNERRLWFGAKRENISHINSHNFNKNYSGQHGVYCDRGVCFSIDPEYYMKNNCPPDATGLQYIYQVRVLTGKFTRGSDNIHIPPPLPGRQDATYDSVRNDEAGPAIFTVFHDAQTYPEYLITFKAR